MLLLELQYFPFKRTPDTPQQHLPASTTAASDTPWEAENLRTQRTASQTCPCARTQLEPKKMLFTEVFVQHT